MQQLSKVFWLNHGQSISLCLLQRFMPVLEIVFSSFENFLLLFSRQDSPFINQHRSRISGLTVNEVQFGGDERPNFVACSFRVNKPRKTYMQNDKFRTFP